MMKGLIKKNADKIGLFIASNTLTHLPCWKWSSRLIDRLIVDSEVE